MVKKIMVTSLWCHLFSLHAADIKAPPTPTTPRTPSVAVSGAVPFHFHVPGLEKATAALARDAAESLKNVKLSIDAEALTNAAKALKEIQLTVNGAPEITLKSGDLEKVAQAFSAKVVIEHRISCVPCCSLTGATRASYAFIMTQLNRCRTCTRKQQNTHVN